MPNYGLFFVERVGEVEVLLCLIDSVVLEMVVIVLSGVFFDDRLELLAFDLIVQIFLTGRLQEKGQVEDLGTDDWDEGGTGRNGHDIDLAWI